MEFLTTALCVNDGRECGWKLPVFVRSPSWTARARLCQPRRCECEMTSNEGDPSVSHHFDSAAALDDGRINPCDLYAFPAAPDSTALVVTSTIAQDLIPGFQRPPSSSSRSTIPWNIPQSTGRIVFTDFGRCSDSEGRSKWRHGMAARNGVAT